MPATSSLSLNYYYYLTIPITLASHVRRKRTPRWTTETRLRWPRTRAVVSASRLKSMDLSYQIYLSSTSKRSVRTKARNLLVLLPRTKNRHHRTRFPVSRRSDDYCDPLIHSHLLRLSSLLPRKSCVAKSDFYSRERSSGSVNPRAFRSLALQTLCPCLSQPMMSRARGQMVEKYDDDDDDALQCAYNF